MAYISTPDRSIVVWSDIAFKEERIVSSGGQGPGFRDVSILTGDGRRVDLKVWTKDGTTLRVAVNGTEYRVADGTTFLVRTRGGPAQVTQLNQHLPGHPLTNAAREQLMSPEEWERLAGETPAVKAFIFPAQSKG